MPNLLRNFLLLLETFETVWSDDYGHGDPHLVGLIRANCLARSCGGPREKPSLTNINTKREVVYLQHNSLDGLHFAAATFMDYPLHLCRLHGDLCGADIQGCNSTSQLRSTLRNGETSSYWIESGITLSRLNCNIMRVHFSTLSTPAGFRQGTTTSLSPARNHYKKWSSGGSRCL